MRGGSRFRPVAPQRCTERARTAAAGLGSLWQRGGTGGCSRRACAVSRGRRGRLAWGGGCPHGRFSGLRKRVRVFPWGSGQPRAGGAVLRAGAGRVGCPPAFSPSPRCGHPAHTLFVPVAPQVASPAGSEDRFKARGPVQGFVVFQLPETCPEVGKAVQRFPCPFGVPGCVDVFCCHGSFSKLRN